ncbi:tetratricopeptide repeat protein [Streptomyces canus]
MTDGGTAVLCQVLAGMGGIGKTQLAAHYARHVWAMGGVDLLVWITATTREAVISAYAQAATEVLGADPADPETGARAFLAWLEPKSGTVQRHWLIVLDDLAVPADLRGLWPPANPHGRTVVTTRRRDAALTGSGRRLVPVDLFTPEEAATYLASALAAHGRMEPPDHLAALATDLGYLPLALSQAAAYLIDADLDSVAYRTLLADRARTLNDALPDASGLPDDQPATTAAALSLSIDRADQLQPIGLARPMLQLTAVLDPNGIPSPVLVSPPALAYLSEHRAGTAGLAPAEAVTAQDAERALRTLHRLSLIDHTPRHVHHAVRVHQLVQRVTREALAPQQLELLAQAAADALTDVWPDNERHTAVDQALRANVETLTRHAENSLWQGDAAHASLFLAGRSLGQSGQVTAAIAYFQGLTRTNHELLGPDHPDTLTARHHLANWQGEAGNVEEAVVAFANLLADRERVLGPDDPETLSARGNLASWRGIAGDVEGAVAAYAELLADEERALGPDHPYTLVTRNNLACLQEMAGDLEGAVAAFAELLADRERVLGPDDPETLITRNNLACLQAATGDVEGAVAALAELLADRERVLGPNHPDTLSTRGNLTYWQGQAGDADRAVAVIKQVLAKQQRVLEPDHPHTFNTRRKLTWLQREAGDVEGAVAALAELLADEERVLGPNHPDTLSTRGNLANWRGKAGDVEGSVAAHAELLIDARRVLGPDHPHVLNLRANLAHWQGEAGDADGAVAAYAELLADEERVLGPNHPDTLNTLGNLAQWRGEAGNPAGAAITFAELLERMSRLRGSDHPYTLAAQDKLAYWRGQAGDAPVSQSTNS